tara:strand:- start:46 stop:363 length:318 start_codon:yes stop_codon:yes gene_type:complete
MRFKLLKNPDGATYLKAMGGGKLSDLDDETVDMLWDQGFRPFEVYISNSVAVDYIGNDKAPAGTVSGWDIKHIFSTPSALKTMPFFDCIIMGSTLSDCKEYWKGI